MQWYLMVWKKYAQFSGRSRRKELWMFALFNYLFFIPLFLIGFLLEGSPLNAVRSGPFLLYLLAVTVPSLAVGVRRLHDIGKSGWCWLIFFVLWPVLIIFWCRDSEPGENQYGPNPKGA